VNTCHNLEKCQKVKNNPMDISSTRLASANLSPRTVNAREKSLGRNPEVTRMQVVAAHPQAGVGVGVHQVEVHLEHLLARDGKIWKLNWTRP
jgi:hypothetical protein